MEPVRTFENSRNGRYHQFYVDMNNYLFKINFASGENMCFILRDLKKNKETKKYIYNKLHNTFGNIAEIDISNISSIEYNLCKLRNVQSVIKVC